MVVLAEGPPSDRVGPLAAGVDRHDERRPVDVDLTLIDAASVGAEHPHAALDDVDGFVELKLHFRRNVGQHLVPGRDRGDEGRVRRCRTRSRDEGDQHDQGAKRHTEEVQAEAGATGGPGPRRGRAWSSLRHDRRG